MYRDVAAAQINVNAAPISLSQAFFGIQLPDVQAHADPLQRTSAQSAQSENLGNNQLDSKPSDHYFYDDDEERLSNVSNKQLVQQQIAQFEQAINQIVAINFPFVSNQFSGPNYDQPQPQEETTHYPTQDGKLGTISKEARQSFFDDSGKINLGKQESNGPVSQAHQIDQVQHTFNIHALPNHDKRSSFHSIQECLQVMQSEEYAKFKAKQIEPDQPIPDVSQFINALDPQSRQYYDSVMAYDDKIASALKIDVDQMRFVYLTSGGGKTNLAKSQPGRYYDIDQFIANRYDKFKIFQEIQDKFGTTFHMSKWFKYEMFQAVHELKGKILLCNHPNQLPNVFRQGFNEVILIPVNANWNLRWFFDNYFSLLGVFGKRKVLTRYDSYHEVITHFFG